MRTAKKIGVSIDDNGLRVMEYTTGTIKLIELPPFSTGREKTGGVFKNNIGSNYDSGPLLQTNYLGQLKSVINYYDELLLFGPTNLKTELCNLLRTDDRFVNANIIIKQTWGMTENQQQDFAMDYFENTDQGKL